MSTEDNKPTHEMTENDDGSVEIILDFDQKDQQKESTQNGFQLAEGGEAEDDDHGDDGDDRDDVRARRREERKAKKEAARERTRSDKNLIKSLQSQLAEMNERLARQEHSSRGYQFAQVDKAIDDEKVRINYAKMKIEEAVANQDGALLNEAQELLFEAKGKLGQLEHHKKLASQQVKQSQQQKAPAVNPSVASNAQAWMSRNKWYDPSLKDADSKITRVIDEQLAEEGFDPADEEYWEELDARLQKRLPHHYGKHVQGNPSRSRSGPPTGGGGGRSDGAAHGAGVGFKLSPERVAAIKAAGKWDDPTARKKMIDKYVEYDKRNAR